MNEKQSNMQEAIYRLLKRSVNSQGHYYAYEISAVSENGVTPVIPRTANIGEFYENMENASAIASEKGDKIRVGVYRGKSPKAQQISSYDISLDEGPVKENPDGATDERIEKAVEKAIAKKGTDKDSSLLGELEGLNRLFGALGNNNGGNGGGKGLGGLFGFIGAVNNNQHQNNMLQFEKKLNEYKLTSRIETLEKDLSKVTEERDGLKTQNYGLEKENIRFKGEVADLENRLAGYSSTELFKRMAVGAISNIGGRILGNSPKAAELMGLTKKELQMALGMVEDDNAPGKLENGTGYDVEISEVDTVGNPKENQILKAIDNTMEALKSGDPKFARSMVSIIGYCMDSEGLTGRMVMHLKEELAKQGVRLGSENQDNEG